FQASEGKNGDVAVFIIRKFPVYLVGNKEEIVFQHECSQFFQLFPGIEVPGGVAGVTDHDGLCFGTYQLFKILNRGEGEIVFYTGGYRYDLYPCRNTEAVVVGVKGFGNDDLITGISNGVQGEQYGFGATGGDDQIIESDVDPYFSVIFNQSFPVGFKTCGMAVFQNFDIGIANGG